MITAPASPAVHVSTTAAGRGTLRIARVGPRSVAATVYATSPLRLLTPSNHGAAAWVYTSSFGGGLVDGDQLRLDVEVEANAAAFVSTQASTKVYRSPVGTGAETMARVGCGGLLVWAPDPVVCFAGSRYRQRQQFDLDAEGGLVVIDCVTSGRRASGERWAFDEYRSQTTVRIDGRLVVHDAVALRAADGDLALRFGRFDVLGTVTIAGAPLLDRAGVVAARVNAWPIASRADVVVSASVVGGPACVVRLAGRSTEQVTETLRRLLDFVPELLGDDPWRRKW